MATANDKAHCFVCNKEKDTYGCTRCSNDFCFPHLIEHRQTIKTQLETIINDHDQFQQTIIQQKQNPHNPSLIQQINRWETNSIHQIQQTAKECRKTLMKLAQKSINDVEKKFIELSQKLKEIREENEFYEIDLNNFQLKLTQITEEFFQSSNISIQQDSQEFIKKISVISPVDILSPSNATTALSVAPEKVKELLCHGNPCPRCGKCFDWRYAGHLDRDLVDRVGVFGNMFNRHYWHRRPDGPTVTCSYWFYSHLGSEGVHRGFDFCHCE